MKPYRFCIQEVAERQGITDLLDLTSRAHIDIRVMRRMWTNWRVEDTKIGQLARVAQALGVSMGDLIVERDISQQERRP